MFSYMWTARFAGQGISAALQDFIIKLFGAHFTFVIKLKFSCHLDIVILIPLPFIGNVFQEGIGESWAYATVTMLVLKT